MAFKALPQYIPSIMANLPRFCSFLLHLQIFLYAFQRPPVLCPVSQPDTRTGGFNIYGAVSSNFSEPLRSLEQRKWLSPNCSPGPFTPRFYHLGLKIYLSVFPHTPPRDCDLLKELESCWFLPPIPYSSTNVGERKKEGRGGGGGPWMSCRHYICT